MRIDAPRDATPSPAMSRLAALKRRVPEVRRVTGKRAWDAVVNRTHGATASRRTQGLASRAYHKMMEIQLSCALPPPTRSLHLCEAPGGFVQAVRDGVVDGTWTWVATSLSADGAPAPATHLLPVHCGTFLVGDHLPGGSDVTSATCVDALASMEAFDLVTADGAAEMDHDDLEGAHRPLLLAETAAATRCLRPGGDFVVKFFEGGSRGTQLWIAWMTTQFGRVSLIKPTASRSTNSELYLVARDFRPTRDDLQDALSSLDQWTVADAWARDVQRVVDRFATDQCAALEAAVAQLTR